LYGLRRGEFPQKARLLSRRERLLGRVLVAPLGNGIQRPALAAFLDRVAKSWESLPQVVEVGVLQHMLERWLVRLREPFY
jgi:hypothetical protein